VKHLFEAHCLGKKDFSNQLWALYVLGLWNREFDPVW